MDKINRIALHVAGAMIAAFLVIAQAVAVRADTDPHYTSIDFPGAAFTVANDVNVQGDIVGLYRVRTASGGLAPPKGFILADGTFTTVQVPGAARTRVFGINDNGDIVGDYLAGGINYGFVRYAGTSTFVPIRFTDGSFASPVTDSWGIDNDGNVTGGYDTADRTFAYVWRDGAFVRTMEAPFPDTTVTYTHGLNAKGEIVGCFWTNDTEMHSLRIMPDGSYNQEDFPGSMISMHWRISPSSIIVGHYVDTTNVTHGYLLKNGEYESIDFPDATGTLAKGIAEIELFNGTSHKLGSRQLLIVGQYNDINNATHGYLLTRRMGVGLGE